MFLSRALHFSLKLKVFKQNYFTLITIDAS